MTPHNKGKRLRLCEKCKRKRYCIDSRSFRLEDGWDWITRTCSKGHEWLVKVGPIARMIEIEMDRVLPNIMRIFERDDTFYARIRR